MAISPQQLKIYLTSAHRAVIFAIAQLSCLPWSLWFNRKCCSNGNNWTEFYNSL